MVSLVLTCTTAEALVRSPHTFYTLMIPCMVMPSLHQAYMELKRTGESHPVVADSILKAGCTEVNTFCMQWISAHSRSGNKEIGSFLLGYF